MKIETFVLVFESRKLGHYLDGQNCSPIETGIKNAINKYCSANGMVERERFVEASMCEEQSRIIVMITSKFERTP